MSPSRQPPTRSKVEIRQGALDARRALSAAERDDLSLCVFEWVVRDAAFQRATSIATYIPADDEVNTWPLIERAWRMKKRVFAPVVEKNRGMRFVRFTADTRLSTNQFGLLEPVGNDTLDPRGFQIVFVPVVAFDADCQRLGMGGGYFDRAFAFMRFRVRYCSPKLIGLAYDCQRVEHITASPWDIRLFRVFTESGIAC